MELKCLETSLKCQKNACVKKRQDYDFVTNKFHFSAESKEEVVKILDGKTPQSFVKESFLDNEELTLLNRGIWMKQVTDDEKETYSVKTVGEINDGELVYQEILVRKIEEAIHFIKENANLEIKVEEVCEICTFTTLRFEIGGEENENERLYCDICRFDRDMNYIVLTREATRRVGLNEARDFGKVPKTIRISITTEESSRKIRSKVMRYFLEYEPELAELVEGKTSSEKKVVHEELYSDSFLREEVSCFHPLENMSEMDWLEYYGVGSREMTSEEIERMCDFDYDENRA